MPLDEAKTIGELFVVLPITGGGARRLREQPEPLVVAEGVGGEPDSACEIRDFQCHTRSLDLGAHSKVKRFLWRRHQVAEQRSHSPVDLVANRPDLLQGLAGGVGQLPIEVSLAGIYGTRVAATHRDNDIGGLDGLVGERLGKLMKQIDADLGHGPTDAGVDLFGWSGTRGTYVDTSLRGPMEQGRRHLGTAGIVDADEQHLGDVRHDYFLSP